MGIFVNNPLQRIFLKLVIYKMKMYLKMKRELEFNIKLSKSDWLAFHV